MLFLKKHICILEYPKLRCNICRLDEFIVRSEIKFLANEAKLPEHIERG